MNGSRPLTEPSPHTASPSMVSAGAVEPPRFAVPSDVEQPERAVARQRWTVLAFILVGCGFVLLGGGNHDLNPVEARLGLAASEGLGPLGRVVGSWDPGFLPGRVALSRLWALGEGGRATSAAVRWPEAIAALGIGLVLIRRLSRERGTRPAVLLTVALFSTIALIHRGSDTGLDFLAGLAVIAAIDRVIHRGTDLVAGLWAAGAFAIGGWPPVLMILLPIIVLGRPGVTLSWKLILPVAVVFGAWSAWVIRVVSVDAWAAALCVPIMAAPPWLHAPNGIALTFGFVWSLAGSTFVLGLPWSPVVILAGWPSVRASWAQHGLERAWASVGAVALFAGTLIPGMAETARIVALASLMVLVASILEPIWSGALAPSACKAFRTIAVFLLAIGGAALMPAATFVAITVPHYRPAAVVVAILAAGLVLSALAFSKIRQPRVLIALMIVLSATIKLGHWGIYVPEWNYRLSQGPWGRAIGNWIPPSWPLYVVHTWPEDLLFHTARHVRQLPAPEVLQFQDQSRPSFVLLLPAEFDHWPAEAPPIVKVHEFEDPVGEVRVLARTKGDMGILFNVAATDRGD